MAYERINWQNEPSEATALNDVNLNKMDSAIYELDGKATTTETAITALQDGKVDKVNGKGLSQVDNVTVTQHVAYGTVVSTIKTYGQDGTEVTSQVCNGIVVDSALSNSSTNPVQNKVVKSAIDEKSTVAISDTLETGTTLANITIDGTTTAIKGSDIEVDDELSPTSENPVENRVIYSFIESILPKKTVSGNPIFIDDASGLNAKELKVTINPIQDLHGQSSPYPAGGGINVWDEEWEVGDINRTTGENSYSSTQIRSKNYIPVLPNTGYYIHVTKSGGTDIAILYYDQNKGFLSAQWGSNLVRTTPNNCYYIRFTSNSTYGGTYEGDISINSPSTDTDYHPYSNICPISGRSYAKIDRVSKNVFNKDNYKHMATDAEYTSGSYLCKTIKLVPNTTYTISSNATATSNLVLLLNNNRQVNAVGFFDLRKASDLKTYTTDSTGNLYIGVYLGGVTNPDDTCYNRISESNLQIELGSTSSDYKPYQEELPITIQFGQTVYDGELDTTSGELTIKWVHDTPSGKTISMINTATTGINRGYYSPNPFIKVGDRYGINVKSNVLIGGNPYQSYGSLEQRVEYCCTSDMSNNRLYFFATDIQTAEGWSEFFEDNDVEFIYELREPIKIQLTPSQVSLLTGENTISTNCDDMELKYSVSLDSLLPTTTRTLAKSPIVEEPKEETDETEEQR